MFKCSLNINSSFSSGFILYTVANFVYSDNSAFLIASTHSNHLEKKVCHSNSAYASKDLLITE